MIILVANTRTVAHRWAKENKLYKDKYRVATTEAGALNITVKYAKVIIVESNKEVERALRWRKILS
ncbi:hypothetical protein D3C87_1016810 [compost metagenome]